MRLITPVKRLALGVLVFALLGFAWDEIAVDLQVDPPQVYADGSWVVECNRVTGGVEVVLESAPDLLFFFEGLTEDIPLGYTVCDYATALPLTTGEGNFVPLANYPQKVSVVFTALSGDLDWANVQTLTLRTRATRTVATANAETTETAPTHFTYARPGNGILTLEVIENDASGPPATTLTVAGLTGTPGTTVSRTTSTFQDALIQGAYPSHEGAFILRATGILKIASGGETFRAGADDETIVSIGDVTSSLGGEHGFIWANSVPAPEGYQPLNAYFKTFGGPYEFKVEGLSDYNFYELDEIPLATLEATPNPFEVLWETNITHIGFVTYETKDTQNRVTYSPIACDNSLITVQDPIFAFDPIAYWLAGAPETNATFIASQTCQETSYTNTASLLIRPAPTSLRFEPGVIEVTNSGVKAVEGIGEHAPLLDYVLGPVQSSAVTISNLTVSAGSEVLEKRKQYLSLKKDGDFEERWHVYIPWTAYYKGVKVAAGVSPVFVHLNMKVKPERSLCKCAEGTQTDNGCISFRQAFGCTPLIAGLPTGFLAIEEFGITDNLFTPAILRYDHPMERRLNVSARIVTTPMGDWVIYNQDGVPTSTSVLEESRLIANADGTFTERFSDRSGVVYNADGVVTTLIATSGLQVPVENLGIIVTRDANGNISQITSTADGSLTVKTLSESSFRITWLDTEGVLVKPFTISKESDDTFLLMDKSYPTRWTWNSDDHDFTLTRGLGDEATTHKRSLHFNADGTAIVTNMLMKAGVIASTDVQIIDTLNDNMVVQIESGGRVLSSATRVTEGHGLGRIRTNVDAFGTTTTYEYDSDGRVTKSTAIGSMTNIVVSAYNPNDPLDQRPMYTYELLNDEVVREKLFAETTNAFGERVETEIELGTTTVTTYAPITSSNLFEAGHIRSVRHPNGRMTYFTYDEDAFVRTSTEGIYTNDTFTLISGKSTRQKVWYDVRGNAVRLEDEAYIDGVWYPLMWETRTYSAAHKHLGSTFSNGKTSDSQWNCTGPIWEVGTDTIATTNTYNTLKQMATSTRYGSFGALTTTYTYDAAGRVIRTQRGDLVSTTTYDLSGRVLAQTDEQGRTTTYEYPSETITIANLPNGGTRITTLNAEGRIASITGTAVTPEYYTYGPDWTLVHYGTPTSARWQKTFTDVLGRTVREERGGANSSTIVTTYTYNAFGQLARIESTGQAPIVYAYDVWGERISSQTGERVPLEEFRSFILIEGQVWLERVRKAGNLEQRTRVNIDGTKEIVVDVRGHETVTTSVDEGPWHTATRTIPGVNNPLIQVSLDGVLVSSIDSACATNTVSYDIYKRIVSQSNGRGIITTREYDEFDRLARTTDAMGAETSYGYDTAGQIIAITNALGGVATLAYDLRGNKIYERGTLSYPVNYSYDVFNQQVSMTTYRNETSATGDATLWTYDEATGSLLAKTHADGRGTSYTLTDLGQIATRTDARGVVTTYDYNLYGDLLSRNYSDETPDITYEYDLSGHTSQVIDATGTTVFEYNNFGNLVTESITGLYNKTLTHHFDAYGREAGYSVNGSRRTTLGYDTDTGRISTMNEGGTFTWEYLPNSNLKSKLTYPSGLTANWTYEPTRDLLTSITNAHATGEVISSYNYNNDSIGRRISKNDEQYGYNLRNELTSANEYTYLYDSIGNRIEAEGYNYTANNLTQYTAINSFIPVYDAEGNQTKILTSTGEWIVEYDAENRPIRWTQGNKVITMGYDRIGRRIFYKEMDGNTQVTYTCFLYDGYLCIQQLFSNSPWNVYKEFIWDPTEPANTRPLCFRQYGQTAAFLMHDGNKNVTDVVTASPNNDVVGHYEYAPFGAITLQTGSRTSANPFRFSSEFHDDTLGLVYYNYRHYNPKDGRWCSRDPLATDELGFSPFAFCVNNPISYIDRKGLECDYEVKHSINVTSIGLDIPELINKIKDKINGMNKMKKVLDTTPRFAKPEFGLSFNGRYKHEYRLCCKGLKINETVEDNRGQINVTGYLGVSVYSHGLRASTDFEKDDNVEGECWVGLKGSLSGDLSGVFEWGGNSCFSDGNELYARIETTGALMLAGGGELNLKIYSFISASLGVTFGIEAGFTHTWWGIKNDSGSGWETVKNEWGGVYAKLFIESSIIFASFRYERSLYP